VVENSHFSVLIGVLSKVTPGWTTSTKRKPLEISGAGFYSLDALHITATLKAAVSCQIYQRHYACSESASQPLLIFSIHYHPLKSLLTGKTSPRPSKAISLVCQPVSVCVQTKEMTSDLDVWHVAYIVAHPL